LEYTASLPLCFDQLDGRKTTANSVMRFTILFIMFLINKKELFV
jgi:hypothetical protein